MSILSHVSQGFIQRFAAPPEFIVRAPGRVNLIGEHTDYNDGFCLPMAIDRAMWIALRPRKDNKVIVHSLDLAESITFDLQHLQRGEESWHKYIEGVA
ncbi:Galactokinase [hydrothermal vent metagenome]|uniref:Galactokinase n=1 Tax=hydrothermal vent metagenome TaxID=652676 RepID=A0A3B0UR92_9ZZZZ